MAPNFVTKQEQNTPENANNIGFQQAPIERPRTAAPTAPRPEPWSPAPPSGATAGLPYSTATDRAWSPGPSFASNENLENEVVRNLQALSVSGGITKLQQED